MNATFLEHLAEQKKRMAIAKEWFPFVEGATGEEILQAGFGLDFETSRGLLDIAMGEPGMVIERNPDTGPNARAIRFR